MEQVYKYISLLTFFFFLRDRFCDLCKEWIQFGGSYSGILLLFDTIFLTLILNIDCTFYLIPILQSSCEVEVCDFIIVVPVMFCCHGR